MDDIKSTSYGKHWLRATSEERQVFLNRSCYRLAQLGITIPPLLVLEQRITELTSLPHNADLDAGRLLEQAIGELRRENVATVRLER